MVMKDKLVKTHHKGTYYTMRKTVLGLLCGFTLIASIVVPTYIIASVSKKNTTLHAQEENSEVVEEESEINEYEEYIEE